MSLRQKFGLFDVFGVELEYMLVDSETLDVRAVCDEVIRQVCGEVRPEISFGRIAWSNELALHVIELKTDGPVEHLDGLHRPFEEHVRKINRECAAQGWRLMPTAMHPWMDPDRELKLWPHEYNPVYEAYNRIFDCRGHGWANLQSVHLNLPFQGDEQFGRLHAAIRLVLPLLPAIAASSPVYAGRVSGIADSRMEFYRTNSARIPSLTAGIVPEPVYTQDEYEQKIFQKIYADISPHDPDRVLQDEFLNSRGAIARFRRGSIEIRVLDVQECPWADIAICELIVALLRALVAGTWSSWADQKTADTTLLQTILFDSIRNADRTVIDSPDYLRQFGCGDSSLTVGQLWHQIVDQLASSSPRIRHLAEPQCPLGIILKQGNLSRRIVDRTGPEPDREDLRRVYAELCECLNSGRMLGGVAIDE